MAVSGERQQHTSSEKRSPSHGQPQHPQSARYSPYHLSGDTSSGYSAHDQHREQFRAISDGPMNSDDGSLRVRIRGQSANASTSSA